jgi:hypothetical protein
MEPAGLAIEGVDVNVGHGLACARVCVSKCHRIWLARWWCHVALDAATNPTIARGAGLSLRKQHKVGARSQ